MSISRNQTNEFHITIDNKIRTANRLIIQTCRLCHLKNRSCYVIAKMSSKCAFCAKTNKIIKQCEVLSTNYINIIENNDVHTSSKNIAHFHLSYKSNNIFVIAFLNSHKSNNFLVVALNNSLNITLNTNTFDFNDHINIFTSTNTLTLVSCSDQNSSVWKIVDSMQNKLSAMKKKSKAQKNKNDILKMKYELLKKKIEAWKMKYETLKLNNQTLKISHQHMIDRIQELKIRVKRLNEMNDVDNAIDILDRNFSEEKRLNEMKNVDDAIDNLDINFSEKERW